MFEYMTVIIYLLPNCFSYFPLFLKMFWLKSGAEHKFTNSVFEYCHVLFHKGIGGGGEATHEQNKILRPLGGSRILRDRMISEDVFPWMLRPLAACL